MDVMQEISKLFKKSPNRDGLFRKLKTELSPDTRGFHVLCPTRWTVRAASLQGVLDNHKALFGVWNEALSSQIALDRRARII